MIHAHIPTEHPARSRRLSQHTMLRIIHDPSGDLTGLAISRYEFAYGWTIGTYEDGTRFKTGGRTYVKAGQVLVDEHGQLVDPKRFDTGDIIGTFQRRAEQ